MEVSKPNTLSGKTYAKMSFTEFLQDECGIGRPFDELLYNLEKDQIAESLTAFATHKKRVISFSQSEIKALCEFINCGF